MATPIEPRDLGAEHIHRVAEVGWQATAPGGVGFRASVRGVLTNVAHDGNDTRVTVRAGLHDVHVNVTSENAEVLIN